MTRQMTSIVRISVFIALLILSAHELDAEQVDGQTRSYFISADEVLWNYAPLGNRLTSSICADADEVWLKRGVDSKAPIFRKAVFHEYSDSSFKNMKSRSPNWEHLGILGPLIRGEVGDKIEVILRNNTHFPISLHAHGVKYDKPSEGSDYIEESASAKKDDYIVYPGKRYVYHWLVPARAGPAQADPSSVAWLYHSHIDGPVDTNSGLVGVILITAKGKARSDGSPIDVDREFVSLYNIFDEQATHFVSDNNGVLVSSSGRMPAGIDRGDVNRFFAINGFICGNLPNQTMNLGEHVRWYLVGIGNEQDMHTPHWHGNTVVASGARTDVIELLPASMKVADMVPDSRGIWLYHCHVDEHMKSGMVGTYEVR